MFETVDQGDRWAHLHPHNRDPDRDLSPFPQFLVLLGAPMPLLKLEIAAVLLEGTSGTPH